MLVLRLYKCLLYNSHKDSYNKLICNSDEIVQTLAICLLSCFKHDFETLIFLQCDLCIDKIITKILL